LFSDAALRLAVDGRGLIGVKLIAVMSGVPEYDGGVAYPQSARRAANR